MENIEHVCRHFKLENCDLEINFTLRDCLVHKCEKIIVYLNFDNDKNIDLELAREKLIKYVDWLLPKHSRWFFSSSREYKLKRK